jgi:hypothetical protein
VVARILRLLIPSAVLVMAILGTVTTVGVASSTPSGERIVGKTVVEPVYDDMTGAIKYVSTPMGAPNPVKSNPRASAPFYLPVYPTGSTVGTLNTLNCQDVPQENCPDHGPAVAAAAAAIMPSVYGAGVIGHDHLMAGPGSGGDFNIAWVPTLVLFTSNAAANQHLILLTDVNTAVADGKAILVRLDGTNGTPNLTFHCSVVPAAVYAQGTPFLG